MLHVCTYVLNTKGGHALFSSCRATALFEQAFLAVTLFQDIKRAYSLLLFFQPVSPPPPHPHRLLTYSKLTMKS